MSFIDDHELWLETRGEQGTQLYVRDNEEPIPSCVNRNLDYSTFKFANLDLSSFYGASLRYTTISSSDMQHSDLTSVVAACARFIYVNFKHTVLDKASLDHAVFEDCYMNNTSFKEADLTGAAFFNCSLDGADFTDADLSNVIGDGEYIKNIKVHPRYMVTYTATHMFIGCQSHTIETWKEMSNEDLYQQVLLPSCVKQWNDNRSFIFDCIDRYPAKAF